MRRWPLDEVISAARGPAVQRVAVGDQQRARGIGGHGEQLAVRAAMRDGQRMRGAVCQIIGRVLELLLAGEVLSVAADRADVDSAGVGVDGGGRRRSYLAAKD